MRYVFLAHDPNGFLEGIPLLLNFSDLGVDRGIAK
jgi:hypothetical protein